MFHHKFLEPNLRIWNAGIDECLVYLQDFALILSRFAIYQRKTTLNVFDYKNNREGKTTCKEPVNKTELYWKMCKSNIL